MTVDRVSSLPMPLAPPRRSHGRPRGRALSAGLFALALASAACAPARPASTACGPAARAVARAHDELVVMARDASPVRAIAVSDEYVAAQWGSDVLIWSIETGTLMSVVRSVTRLEGPSQGEGPSGARFLVARGAKMVLVDAIGREVELGADKPLSQMVPVPGGRPGRYLGTFEETSAVQYPMWVDASGRASVLHFDLGCPAAPGAVGAAQAAALSPNGRWVVDLTRVSHEACMQMLDEPRFVRWSLDEPSAKGTVLPAPGLEGDLLAVSDSGSRAVLRLEGGVARAEVVDGKLVASGPPLASAMAAASRGAGWGLSARIDDDGAVLLWGATGAERFAAAATTSAWHRDGDFGWPRGGDTLLIQKRDELDAVDPSSGEVRARFHFLGIPGPDAGVYDRPPVAVSPGGRWLGVAQRDRVVVFDARTGRPRRKLLVPALRRADEVEIVGDRVVVRGGSEVTWWSLAEAEPRARATLDPGPWGSHALARRGDELVVAHASDCRGSEPAAKRARFDRDGTLVGELGGCAAGEVDPATGASLAFDLRGDRPVFTFDPGDGTASRPLELSSPSFASEAGGTELVVAAPRGRRAAAGTTAQVDEGDQTSVVGWDTTSGAVLFEVPAPRDAAQRRDLFKSQHGEGSYVTTALESLALDDEGRHLATVYRYVLMNKPNWSWERVERVERRLTIRDATTGSPQGPDLDVPCGALRFAGGALFTAGEGGVARLVPAGAGWVVAARGTFDGGAAQSIAVEPEKNLVATAHVDGLVRVWRADTLELVATLIDYTDDEHVVVTPEGLYAGTPESGARLTLRFGPAAYAIDQFAATLSRPADVRARLGGAPPADPGVGQPPKVELVRAPARAGKVAHVTVRAASSARVDAVRAYVEGRQVAEARVCAENAEIELEIPLAPGKNRLTLVAFDARGSSSNPLSLELEGEGAERPDVWVVAAGIDHYPRSPGFSLDFAGADARAVADLFRRQAGPSRPYAEAHVRLLLDEEATPEAIGGALEGLDEMRPNDLAVVLLSGHGMKPRDADEMVFLTSAARIEGDELTKGSLQRDVVRWSAIGAALEHAKGRVLVLVDACHAGHIDRTQLAPNADLAQALAASGRAGTVLFAASKGRQLSMESGTAKGVRRAALAAPVSKAGHGRFTQAILDAFDDRESDHDGDGALQLSELVDEVTFRVEAESGGTQSPWVARRELFGDFLVGRSRR